GSFRHGVGLRQRNGLHSINYSQKWPERRAGDLVNRPALQSGSHFDQGLAGLRYSCPNCWSNWSSRVLTWRRWASMDLIATSTLVRRSSRSDGPASWVLSLARSAFCLSRSAFCLSIAAFWLSRAVFNSARPAL